MLQFEVGKPMDRASSPDISDAASIVVWMVMSRDVCYFLLDDEVLSMDYVLAICNS